MTQINLKNGSQIIFSGKSDNGICGLHTNFYMDFYMERPMTNNENALADMLVEILAKPWLTQDPIWIEKVHAAIKSASEEQ